MKVSLNWLKNYIDFPDDLSPEQIAYDLTMRTVEVDKIEYPSEKFHDIVVGQILSVAKHPNADTLKICMTDIGDGEPKQIVCGGSNLYEGEMVVVCKPGAEVYWHGEDKLMEIKETKMRGEYSYGMICAAAEVYLEDYFPTDDERIIVDLKDVDCHVGQSVAELIGMDDVVLEIDNKSLTNRPDLWGHYGVARELSAIYELELKPLPSLDKSLYALPEYPIEIEEPERCPRFTGLEIDNVYIKDSPIWMKTALLNGGMRPINAIVDITNYVMLSVGQPSHGYDKNHIEGGKIIVRTAREGEKLILLGGDSLDLTGDDLVICDTKEAMNLAGIKGGIKDSILPDTTEVFLEVANFSPTGLRRTENRFNEKTDASMRYEKGLDTERVDLGIAMCTKLFKELYPECRFVKFGDNYQSKTERAVVSVSQEFLNDRLGKVLSEDTIVKTLKKLQYDVEFKDGVYSCIAPIERSTGDISIKDDVLGDLARILSYESFEPTPLNVRFEHSVNQPKWLLQKNLREFLAFRCGYNEIFTYPWVDEKFISAAGIDTGECIKLATPPAPELANLRKSLVPGCIESVAKNLRYYDEFKIFEMAQVFEKGEYHPSSDDETLPVQNMMLTGAVVSNDAKKAFFDVKGTVEEMVRTCQMKGFEFKQIEKPSWADEKVYLNLVAGDKFIGSIGLLKVSAMNDAGIKRVQVGIFEINVNKLKPLPSRDNSYKAIPIYPLVEEDLSILVDETVKWGDIKESLKHFVKDIRFIEEYRGKQVPEGKKSLMFRLWIGNDDSTMNAKQIEKKMGGIINTLKKQHEAILRDE